MKSKVKLMGIIAVIAIIGLSMAACGNGDCTHDFSQWQETTAPTCVSKGIETGTCSCGATSTRDGAAINPNAHAFSVTPATCSTDSIPGTCTRNGCNEPNTDEVVSAGHYLNSRNCTVLCFDFGMVLVEKGTFTMGPDIWSINTGGNGEETVEVTFTKDFRMSKYLVTQELYEEIMGVNPSFFLTDAEDGEIQGRRPVEMVTWFDTLDFCNKLSEAEGLEPVYTLTNITTDESGRITWITGATLDVDFSKNGYRLPTDAQWEYAAKGGNGSSSNFTYSGSNNVDEVAWYSVNSNSITHEVGKKAPNGFGIYDMSGNVWEWCWDWWGSYPVEPEPMMDYEGVVSGDRRVRRGGSFINSAENMQSVSRRSAIPDYGDSVIGFRVARP